MFREPTIFIKQTGNVGVGQSQGVPCLPQGKKKTPKIAAKIKSPVACGCR